MSDEALTNTEATIERGLEVVGQALQAALAAKPVDATTVRALDALRSRYVFNLLQLKRDEIARIDASPRMHQALAELASAAQDLDGIHQKCRASTQWIHDASRGLDRLMDASTRLKALG